MDVTATAPVRICDAGGWTDTWFAGSGIVCNLACEPGPRVRVVGEPSTPARRASVVRISAPGVGERFEFVRGAPPGRHPLIEATVGRWAPPGLDLDVTIDSVLPVGAGIGGSAAVVVALVAALRGGEGALEPDEVARCAHEIETVELGWQSGVQDQIAAAHGGALVCRIDAYPRWSVERLVVPPAMERLLRERLVTVFLGPHQSSAVHGQVIKHLEGHGDHQPLLGPLRRAAVDASHALTTGDLEAYGAALTRNTAAQAALHPELVGPAAHGVARIAARHRALGWKVNGAGGEGGTVTIVAGAEVDELRAELTASLPGALLLDVRPTAVGCVVS